MPTVPSASRLIVIECAFCNRRLGWRRAEQSASPRSRIASRLCPWSRQLPPCASCCGAISLYRRASTRRCRLRIVTILARQLILPRQLHSAERQNFPRLQGTGQRTCLERPAMPLTCLPASRYGRIAKAVSSGAAARLLSAAITLVSLPLAVRYLGAERYGVWATITTTAVWINLLDLGIANTLTNSISRSYALGDKASAARYFTNALLITGSIAALVGGAFAVVSSRVNWMKLFNVSANVQAAEVRDTVVVAAALMLLGLPCNLGGKLLAGYQELHRNNYAVCAGAVASVIGLAVGIAWRVSMPALFVMSVGCLTFGRMANLIFVVTWHKPWLLPQPALIDRSTSKDLFS